MKTQLRIEKDKFLKNIMQNKMYGNNVLWNEANIIGKKMIDIKDTNFIISISLIRYQIK